MDLWRQGGEGTESTYRYLDIQLLVCNIFIWTSSGLNHSAFLDPSALYLTGNVLGNGVGDSRAVVLELTVEIADVG